jgi:hypothetical protein
MASFEIPVNKTFVDAGAIVKVFFSKYGYLLAKN